MRELGLGQELGDRGLCEVDQALVVGAVREHAAISLVERQLGAIDAQREAVHVTGVGLGKVVRRKARPRAIGARALARELAELPLVGGVGAARRRLGAPQCRGRDLVADARALAVVRGGANLCEIGVIAGRVARGREHRREQAAGSVAERHDAVHGARQLGGVVAQVAHGGLEVHDGPGGAT